MRVRRLQRTRAPGTTGFREQVVMSVHWSALIKASTRGSFHCLRACLDGTFPGPPDLGAKPFGRRAPRGARSTTSFVWAIPSTIPTSFLVGDMFETANPRGSRRQRNSEDPQSDMSGTRRVGQALTRNSLRSPKTNDWHACIDVDHLSRYCWFQSPFRVPHRGSVNPSPSGDGKVGRI